MAETVYDCVIIGAGAAGLMAAMELSKARKKVFVLEALDRIGGRVFDTQDPTCQYPFQLGAEFIHGHLPITLSLLNKAGIRYHKTSGSFWQVNKGSWRRQTDFPEDFEALQQQFKQLEQDVSVEHFLTHQLKDNRFALSRDTLRQYVEGYYAADTHKASVIALFDELSSEDEANYIIDGGYNALLQWMHNFIVTLGGTIVTSTPVSAIQVEKNHVIIQTGSGHFRAKTALLTVSTGVLQAGDIQLPATFNDRLPWLQQLGFGRVIKVVVAFHQPIWQEPKHTGQQEASDLSFIFSEAIFPTWWTHYPKQDKMLTGWLSGPKAEHFMDHSIQQIEDVAIASLCDIFQMEEAAIRKQIKIVHVYPWLNQPYFRGAYSYQVIDGARAQAEVGKTIGNRLFFAGEGFYSGPEIGTVEAAFSTSLEAVKAIKQQLP